MLMGPRAHKRGPFVGRKNPPTKMLYVTLEDSAKGTVLATMRFVSAHFGAETRRRRWQRQLNTLRQASHQLHHHFVAH
jgi:hypothetical protein